MTRVYQANSETFDNSRTGFYPTEEAALAAWWSENNLTVAEAARARPYVRDYEVTAEVREEAESLAAAGSPSPALGIAATA